MDQGLEGRGGKKSRSAESGGREVNIDSIFLTLRMKKGNDLMIQEKGSQGNEEEPGYIACITVQARGAMRPYKYLLTLLQ